MRIDVPRTALWVFFAALLVASGVVVLRACELGALPLFGQRYCVAIKPDDPMAAERGRAQELQARIREAELRIAEKPNCPPPAIAPEPDKPQPIKEVPPPRPDPQPPNVEEQLKIPTKIADLKGCWESVRGDLDIVTDDERELPIGKVRKCYCFGANGRGQLKLSYTDGARCRAPIAADLRADTLRIHQPEFQCAWKGQNRGLVPFEITCRGVAEGEAALCDIQSLGRRRNVTSGEQYRRVEKDHCS